MYFAVGLASSVFGQNTNYGTGSGTLGTNNSNFGYNAGNDNIAGSASNAFFGTNSGRYNTTGDSNSFFGMGSGRGNTTGGRNTAIGESALFF